MTHVFPLFLQIKITTNQAVMPLKPFHLLLQFAYYIVACSFRVPMVLSMNDMHSQTEIVSTNKLLFMLLRCNMSAQGSVAFPIKKITLY